MDIRSDVFSVFGRSPERTSGLHQGVDLLTRLGSEVTAVDGGNVVATGFSKTWSNYVVLGHKNDQGRTVSFSAYMHCIA